MKKALFLFILFFTINVYAKDKCYVTFQYDEIKTVEVTCGNVVEAIEINAKENQQFLGWYYEGEIFDFNTLITSDVLLVATYASDDEKIDESITANPQESNNNYTNNNSGNFYNDMSETMRSVLLFGTIGIAALIKLVIIPKIKERKIKKSIN